MEKIKELIVVIQILTGAIAAVRIAAILFEYRDDEDYKKRNKKLTNVVMAIIIIETATSLGILLYRYYL